MHIIHAATEPWGQAGEARCRVGTNCRGPAEQSESPALWAAGDAPRCKWGAGSEKPRQGFCGEKLPSLGCGGSFLHEASITSWPGTRDSSDPCRWTKSATGQGGLPLVTWECEFCSDARRTRGDAGDPGTQSCSYSRVWPFRETLRRLDRWSLNSGSERAVRGLAWGGATYTSGMVVGAAPGGTGESFMRTVTAPPPPCGRGESGNGKKKLDSMGPLGQDGINTCASFQGVPFTLRAV